MTNSDLEKEIKKYSEVAKKELFEIRNSESLSIGIDRIPEKHQQPFLEYYHAISELIYPGIEVLELGAGTGIHSSLTVELGAKLTALDISSESLEVLSYKLGGKVKLLCADMNSIPLPDDSFDLVISCGSLSYGNPNTVYQEVMRLLKPGGSIIFLDTLNHNWIYSLNRYKHYIQGRRTFSSLKWMPRMKLLGKYESRFQNSQVKFYGKLLWLYGFLQLVLTQKRADVILRSIDGSRLFKRSAFKFLLVCNNLIKPVRDL